MTPPLRNNQQLARRHLVVAEVAEARARLSIPKLQINQHAMHNSKNSTLLPRGCGTNGQQINNPDPASSPF